jgi:hypothetical protein
MNDRSPYDESKVIEDYVDETIKDIVDTYAENGFHILVVSGRHDSCMGDTDKWLNVNAIHHDRLLMRKTGDDRKDYIVKKEIYDEYIKGKYNVTFVLDDRDQVVQMWREQGLKTLQVAEGDF